MAEDKSVRFIAKMLPGVKVDAEETTIRLGLAADQLLRVVHVIPFIVGTTPQEREFSIRMLAKGGDGFKWRAVLWAYHIDHDGYTKLTLRLEKGFSINALAALIDKIVAVEVNGGEG